MCSLKNGLWLLKYAGRPTQKKKMIKSWSRKKTIDENIPHKLKDDAERERKFFQRMRRAFMCVHCNMVTESEPLIFVLSPGHSKRLCFVQLIPQIKGERESIIVEFIFILNCNSITA